MNADTRRPEPAFGGLGRRCMAFMLDFVLATTLVVVVMQTEMALGAAMPIWAHWLVPLLYLGILPATPMQATIGKRMVDLRICDRSGKRIGLARSLLRLAAFVPSIGLAGAGFIIAAFTPRRQALHDLVAGTFVVSRAATTEQVSELPAPVSMTSRIGIILAVALVAYGAHAFVQFRDNYLGGEAMHELLPGVHAYKDEVEKALRSGGAMPSATKLPPHVRAMSAGPDGTIVVQISDAVAPGARLTYRPGTLTEAGYLWTCRAQGLPTTWIPAICRG